MTVSQEFAIKRIKLLANKDGWELKSLEIQDLGIVISVIGEIGMPGDEECALLRATFRHPFHLHVGIRGDISRFVKKGNAWIVKEFKGYSILEAIYGD